MIRQAWLLILLVFQLFGGDATNAQDYAQSTNAPAPGRKVALVIGNSDYRSVGLLANPVGDANLVAEALRKVGFDLVTVAPDLDRAAFERALRLFRTQALGAQVAMVYYAGHGIEDGGRNWLIPVDAQLQSSYDLAYESIDLDRVMESVAGARVRLVVLDACRNSPFAKRWTRTTRSMMRGLGEISADDYLVIFAAAPGQTASDGFGLNSPFAVSLARRIQQVDLPVQLLGNAVRDDVLEATGGQQRPFVSSSISALLVYLAPRPSLPAGYGDPKLALDFASVDVLAWKGALKANSRAAFEAYRTQFPNGRFVRLAEQNVRRFSSSIPRIQPVSLPASQATPAATPAAAMPFAVLGGLPRAEPAAMPNDNDAALAAAATADGATADDATSDPADRMRVASLNLGIQAHNDAITAQNRVAQEKYQAQVAAVEEKVRLQREAYQRELDRFAGEEAKWRARVRACETGNVRECGESAAVAVAVPRVKAHDEVLSWPEAVVVCQLAAEDSGHESRCYGPGREVEGPIGTREGDRAIEKACGVKQGIRDLGAVGGFRVYGCGFGIHPEPRPGTPRHEVDRAAKFNLTEIPGRGTFHCPRNVTDVCRAL